MIEPYIMIIMMGNSKAAVTTEVFLSKESCEMAKHQILKERKDQGYYNGWTFISCVKK
jgi:hypothetical protein